MKIVVIDGQGGSLGRALVEQLRLRLPEQEIIAVGTNSIATAAMLRAGASRGATGENPVRVNAAEADLILGPLGLVLADALLGEVTPAMATAVGAAKAVKLLVPVSRCSLRVAGVAELPLSDYVRLAAEEAARLVKAGGQ